MAMRNWLKGLLSLLFVGAVIYGVCGGEPKKAGGEPSAPSVEAPVALTYGGRNFEEWVQEFRTELEPTARQKALKALIAFGANGKAPEVTPLILELLDTYDYRVAEHLLQLSDDGIETSIKDPNMVSEFRATGIVDSSELQLFSLGLTGLARLAPNSIPQLEKYVAQPGKPTAGRMCAVRAFGRTNSIEWLRLLPELANRDEQTSNAVLFVWKQEDPTEHQAEYRECLQKLLAVKYSTAVRNLMNNFTEAHPVNYEVILPLLAHFETTTPDASLRELAKKTTKLLVRLEGEYKKTEAEPAMFFPPFGEGRPFPPVQVERIGIDFDYNDLTEGEKATLEFELFVERVCDFFCTHLSNARGKVNSPENLQEIEIQPVAAERTEE